MQLPVVLHISICLAGVVVPTPNLPDALNINARSPAVMDACLSMFAIIKSADALLVELRPAVR